MMRMFAGLRAYDETLRIRWPRIWALRLHYLAAPLLLVPLVGTMDARWIARPTPWTPIDRSADTGRYLAISSALIFVWVAMTARARNTLPRGHRIGWIFGPTCTVLVVACALIATILANDRACRISLRAALSREQLLADAASLGVPLVPAGTPWVPRTLSPSGNDGPGQFDAEATACVRLRSDPVGFETTVLRHLAPEERSEGRHEIVELARWCAAPAGHRRQGPFAPDPVRIWRRLVPFAEVHGLRVGPAPEVSSAPWSVIALDVAVLATAVMAILILTSFAVLRRVLLVLSAIPVVVVALVPVNATGIGERMAEGCAALAVAGYVAYLLALVTRALQRRSPVTDYLLCMLLLLPVLGAGLLHATNPASLVSDHGWGWHDIAGWQLWLPRNPALWPPLALALGFAAVSPVVQLILERYRGLRWDH